MSLRLDPIFQNAFDQVSHLPIAPRGDEIGLRSAVDRELIEAFSTSEPAPDVHCQTYSSSADDGFTVSMRWYSKRGSSPGSAVVFAHGGGMIAGSVEIYDPFVRQHVQWTGVPMLSVEYRLAPEVRGDAPARDVFVALQWLVENGGGLGVDTKRIVLMGDSAGGGIAAGAAILARDEGVAVAGQLLIFPMIDDRTSPADPHLSGVATWTYEENDIGWNALLDEERNAPDVSPYAAPARLSDHAGLPRTYIEVGALDIFRDECIGYALSLLRAGVDTELHVHPGAPHGYDTIAPESPFAARWKSDRIRVLTSF